VEEHPQQHVWAEHAGDRQQNVKQKLVGMIAVSIGACWRDRAPFAELHSRVCVDAL
jgi:hypothetical protein